MEEVAGDAAVDGAAPRWLGTKRRQHREIESRRKMWRLVYNIFGGADLASDSSEEAVMMMLF